jgi:hypothetical protein
MARYFFHLRNGENVLLDTEGSELDGGGIPGRALAEARALIADEAKEGRIRLDQRIEVENASRGIVQA